MFNWSDSLIIFFMSESDDVYKEYRFFTSSLISEICFSNELILFEISFINIFNSSKSFFASELTLLLSDDSFL